MWVIYILLLIRFVPNVNALTDEAYHLLPKYFELENYYECKSAHKNYCKADILLMPIDENNTSITWKIIEKTLQDVAYYDRSIIHVGVCVKNLNGNLSEYILQKYSEKLTDYGLKPKSIQDTKCINPTPELSSFDISILFLTLILLLIVAFATVKNWTLQEMNNSGYQSSSENEKILMFFSVKENWKRIKEVKRKYAFLEGMRTVTMIIIIISHGSLIISGLYIENPDFFENLMENFLLRIFTGVLWFMVQVNFLLSAMLLVLHFMGTLERNNNIRPVDVSLFALNRLIRLSPALLLKIGFHLSNIPQILADGVLKDYAEKECYNCKKHWPLTLTFTNNFVDAKDMCIAETWYLAADTQLYILSLLLCFLFVKSKINFYILVGSTGVLAIFFNLYLNYSYDYPGVVQVFSLKTVSTFLANEQIGSQYFSTHSNMCSYMMGLMLGMICFQSRDKEMAILNKWWVEFLWYVLSFGLPIVSIVLIFYNYSTLTNVLLGAIVKPLFALGFAVMIFGMMKNENVTLRKFFQWRPIVFLGNFTYSTYLYHSVPVLLKFVRISTPIQVNSFILVSYFLLDVILSYSLGIIMFFVVEFPASQLQKQFVPNVKTKPANKSI
ncbi:hypothetical protein HHI36_003312 [Cryptolaemus montrouzieri]|uniref:Acyltransferase 3 domain-containing protein n=1 Tax=Cryptolaemus montrouzieri TaxID=559131 RepID=A0ABD2PDQ7_9CUCU